MTLLNHGRALALVACCLGAYGCGQSADDGPEELVPVSGLVTVDENAADGVVLTFQPVAGTAGTGGFGATDATGSFKVMHRSGREGIEPGSYKVTMSRMLKPDGSPVPSGESAMDHNAEEAMPPQYLDPEQTPLHVEVTAGMAPLALDVKTK